MADGKRHPSAPSESHMTDLSIVPDAPPTSLKDAVMRIANMCVQLIEAERRNALWRDQMEAKITLILEKLSG